MRSLSTPNHVLRLEPLEARTLLAGMEDIAFVIPAVSGSGDFSMELNPRFWYTELVIVGGKGGNLEINFDLLPAFVTSIDISSFDGVVFKGQDTLKQLVVTDIKSLNAPSVSITTMLFASNVGTIEVAAAGDQAVFKGQDTKLIAGNLNNTVIISDLQAMEITSTSSEIFIISLNSTQVVKLSYEPAQVSAVGLGSAERQILVGARGLDTGAPIDTDTKPNGVVVVDVPTDERTDALLARLRDLVRSGRNDSQQLVFELVNGNSLFEIHGSRPVSLPTGEVLDPQSLSWRGNVGQISDEPLLNTSFGNLAEQSKVLTLGDMEFARARTFETTTDEHGIAYVLASERSPGWIDATVPMKTGPVGEVSSGDAVRIFDEIQGVLVGSVRSNPMDLQNHILDRITSELSPAVQTAFLLVDPKPARPGLEKNRESGLVATIFGRPESIAG